VEASVVAGVEMPEESSDPPGAISVPHQDRRVGKTMPGVVPIRFEAASIFS
jgi:hypothetical protein